MVLLADGDIISVDNIPQEILDVYRRKLSVPETYEELKEMKKVVKNEAVAGLEREFISSALVRYDWNVSRAAEAVGMDRRYLQNLIKKYGIKKGN